MKDKFGKELKVNDDVITYYNHTLSIGKIVNINRDNIGAYVKIPEICTPKYRRYVNLILIS